MLKPRFSSLAASYDVASKYLAGPVGRFDRTVSVGRPDRQGRVDILGVHIGMGSHSFPFLLNFILLCPFPLDLSSLCPPYNPT